VTSYITTDIAAAPFLWVIPLALYLLTFVAVFRERPWLAQARVVQLLPIVAAPLAISLLGRAPLFWFAVIAINLLAFTLLALLCHADLYRRRPAPARLTEFYLWISLGGVLGGIFAALIAPNIFNRAYEYPILVIAALLAWLACSPVAGGAWQPRSARSSSSPCSPRRCTPWAFARLRQRSFPSTSRSSGSPR
jgi:hypothetical protein